MLKNARNYEQELQKKLRDTWYDLNYQFYHSSSYHSDLKLEDECRYDFVSVNSKDEIVGFFSYRIDREVNSVRHFGAISFDQNSVLFARDMAQAIDDIFNKYNFNRMEWYCVDGNPILDSYKRFCEKHGGIIMAHEHECVRTLDGQLRDSWGFEILKKNYINILENNKGYDKNELIREFASHLNGREYLNELKDNEIKWAADHGLVVVYGCSDDNIEFEGAICDEIDAFEGRDIFFSKEGQFNDGLPNQITAHWCKKISEGNGTVSWSFETDIPHETFMIYDYSIPYCEGIVFSIDDLK